MRVFIRKHKAVITGLIVVLMICVLFSVLRLFALPAVDDTLPSPAARDRPIIKDGTVLTDRGTLLRGMVFGVDEMLMGNDNEEMRVTYEDIALMREQGINCIRFSVPLQHLEKDGEDYLKSLEATDTFIDWAEELGLYVWLSADNAEDPEAGIIRFDSIRDYWHELAPRYANRPHVFYDLVNELSEPSDSMEWIYPRGVITEFYAELFSLVRKHAPDTLCIFFSFSHLIDREDIVRQIKGLQELAGISWTNEAVGFHGYETVNGYRAEDIWISSELMRAEIKYLREYGYPIINTEVPSMTVSYGGKTELSDFPNAYLLRVLEEEGVSWNTMMDIQAVGEPSVWRATIERANLTWEPDFGSWPAPGLINPYERRAAIAYPNTSNSSAISLGEYASIEEMGNVDENHIPCMLVTRDSWITYADVNFGVLEPFSLTVRARGFYDGATIIAREGGLDGPVICEIPIRYTKGENVYYTAYLTRPISGVKNITFTFADPKDMDCWALCYFIEWQFNEPPLYTETIRTDIWNNTTPAAYYNFRSGENIYRMPSTDLGAYTEIGRTLQIEGIRDDSRLLYSLAPFMPGGDVIFTVRAKTLTGGCIEIYPNKGFKLWPQWMFYLGQYEINGTRGEWEEFTFVIPAELVNQVTYGGTRSINGQDLMLRFIALDSGSADDELFVISEFRFSK